MHKCNLNYLLIFLIIFFASLDGLFRFRALFSLLVLFIFILVGIKGKFKIDFSSKHLVYFIFLSLIFLTYTALSFLYPDIYLQIPADNEKFIFKIFDRFSLIILFFLIPFVFLDKKYIYVFKSVAYVHVFIFLFQFFMYYFLSIKLDITGYFGESQRTSLGVDGVNFFRASGLYVEPSNYTAYLSTLLFPYYYFARKFNYNDLIPPITMLATFSTVGFLSGFLILLGIFVKNKLYTKWYGAISSILLSFVLFIILSIHYLRLTSDSNVASNIRYDLLRYVYESRSEDLILALFGTGIYSYDKYIYGREVSSFGRDIASIQDLGLFVYCFITMGFLGFILLSCLFFKTKRFSNKLFLLSVLFSKMTYLFPIFIFLVVYIIYSKPEEFK